MPIPDINELASKFGGGYKLIMLASKRAREIVERARPLVRINSSNPLNIALTEIGAGKIKAWRIRSSTKLEENMKNL